MGARQQDYRDIIFVLLLQSTMKFFLLFCPKGFISQVTRTLELFHTECLYKKGTALFRVALGFYVVLVITLISLTAFQKWYSQKHKKLLLGNKKHLRNNFNHWTKMPESTDEKKKSNKLVKTLNTCSKNILITKNFCLYIFTTK